MHDAWQWIALFGMVGIGVVFVREVLQWRALGSVLSRRQRILRVFSMLSIEALFVMMLIGPVVTQRKDPIGSLVYWMVCLVVGLAVVALVLLDVRGIAGQYARLNRQIFRDLRGDDRREK